MSLFSLFSPSGDKNIALQPEVRTGFMGKIPAKMDFIRHQAGTPEIQVMDQWIHEGIAYLSRRFPSDWKDRLDRFSPICCYIGGDHSIHSLSGVIRPSHDTSGRQHPFIDFATCSSLPVIQSLPYIPLRYAAFYKNGGNLKRLDGSDLDTDGLIQQSVALALMIPKFNEDDFKEQRKVSWAGKTSLEFWDSILPGTSSITRINFARDVLQTLKMAASRGPERIAWGLRLPILEGNASNAIVSFWMSLLVGVLGSQKWRPHVFWFPQNNGAATLTLYFRSPNASSFAQLICPEVDEGGVVDLVRRPLENLPEITSAHLKNLVEIETSNWSEMLEDWIKG